MNTPQQQPTNDTPIMTVANGRPTTLMAHLHSSTGILVQCRLPSGEDTFVPLSEIMNLIEKDLVAKIRKVSGTVN